MRKLILKMSISLDGFVGGPKGELDWLFRAPDPEAAAWTVTGLWQAGVHIMGSRTFQDMAAFWPFSKEIFAPVMNELPKVVFTTKGVVPSAGTGATAGFNDATAARTARGEVPLPGETEAGNWRSPRVASGPLADEVARLKQEPGKEIVAHGGARFAQSLVQAGLVDEYRLLKYPVALGRGMGLFSTLARPLELERVSTTTFASGLVAETYRPK